ncbi:TetR/AcrR family transcriptional regulator [Streptomyces sp. TS71-3]|uniref:TetR/AcrR family transcriptional regulator n=1 Tax=Streptomyces sp. TS71-3 TaxID=2733862 RepID=UPI001B101ED5|nr:TetR/AcrR family transcriptional regulator [Streptomyces sp. TS71-3]GHJ37060.1 TetR family transcriptional regulator [Streptomyces sp. TS71-3]
MTSVMIAGRVRHAGGPASTSDDADTFRRRLLDGLADSIAANGYRNTTIADIVRQARTSRRTFYEHFPSREACFVALLTEKNAEMVGKISAAVDPASPWEVQVRQAVATWIRSAESAPAITVSWIRDVPSLGAAARELQRDMMESFITMIQTLCDTEEWHAAGAGPVSRQVVIILLGGLRELIATTVEDDGRVGDITEPAVRASVALLGPRA